MMGNMSRFHIRSARPDEAGLFYTDVSIALTKNRVPNLTANM